MIEVSYGTIEESRAMVIAHIQQARADNPNYCVVDIGGEAGGSWSNNYIDVCVDINAQDSTSNRPQLMRIDICDRQQWDRLLEHVAEHGLFDYCICTHTLEDIYNPVEALRLMPKIAREGIIATPSVNTELSCHEGGYLGYIHHRWIFTARGSQILVVPKLSVLEGIAAQYNLSYDNSRQEVRFKWCDTIEWAMFMDNYLGPTPDAVSNEFRAVIEQRSR